MLHTYISLGSNQGDTLENLELAKSYIFCMKGIYPEQSSNIYYTEPQGVKDQSWFANQVIRVLFEPFWTAESLLKGLLRIEDQMGRIRTKRFGPRIVDLDILLFANQELQTPDLVLPHPRMHQRAFVLIPLLELDKELALPNGQKLNSFLENLNFWVRGDKIWQD